MSTSVRATRDAWGLEGSSEAVINAGIRSYSRMCSSASQPWSTKLLVGAENTVPHRRGKSTRVACRDRLPVFAQRIPATDDLALTRTARRAQQRASAPSWISGLVESRASSSTGTAASLAVTFSSCRVVLNAGAHGALRPVFDVQALKF